MIKRLISYPHNSIYADTTIMSMDNNEDTAVDIQVKTGCINSELIAAYKAPKKVARTMDGYRQQFINCAIVWKVMYTVEQLYGISIINRLSQLNVWYPGCIFHYFIMLYAIKRGEAIDRSIVLHTQALLKDFKLASLASLILTVPGADAISEFDLKKTIPAVYSQLAQNAVVTSFGVLCSSDGGRPPLDALCDGPLSSISSAVWLWRMRKDRGRSEQRRWEFTDDSSDDIITPIDRLRESAIDSLPVIAIISGSFIIYFLSFLESHEWKWALTVSVTGLASEAARLLATWLATASVESVLKNDDDFSHEKIAVFMASGREDMTFIEFQNGRLQSTITWQKFTAISAVTAYSLYGHATYTWQWVCIKKAIMSLLLFCVSAMLAIFSTGALVASEDGSLLGGFLSFIICCCAAGKLSTGTSANSSHPDVYYELLSATSLGAIVGQIGEYVQADSMHSRDFVTYSLLAKSDTITYHGRKFKVYKPKQENVIEMHDVYRSYADLDTRISRMFHRTEDYDGRSIMLEIADALYCRALLLIRHVHFCRHREPSVRRNVCNADTTHFLSAILLVSHHVDCPYVREILSDIKAWMDHEDLLWSIIGSKVTLEMMALPHLRAQLKSSNTLDLALRMCHMAMYENVPTGNMLEAVPTAMYYLLTGDTALGHAPARVVQNAVRTFGAINISPYLNEVILTVGDQYKILCKGELHPWPGGFIPIMTGDAVTDQPANYNMARAMFAPMLGGPRLGQRETQRLSRLSII